MLELDAGTEQQAPKQLDPEGLEVALTQLGLWKPHTLVAGFNSAAVCAEYSEMLIAQR